MAAESELQERYFSQAGAVVQAAYQAAMQGGEIQAAVRQGFNELGTALKAFPDAIQVDEPGAAFNPLFRDIPSESKTNDRGGPDLPTPSEIASGKFSGSVYGDTPVASNQPLPSPSEIASGQYSPSPEPDHGLDRGRGM